MKTRVGSMLCFDRATYSTGQANRLEGHMCRTHILGPQADSHPIFRYMLGTMYVPRRILYVGCRGNSLQCLGSLSGTSGTKLPRGPANNNYIITSFAGKDYCDGAVVPF